MEKRINRFLRIFFWLSLPFLIGWDFHWFEPAARKNNRAVHAYQDKEYKESLQLLLEAKGLKEDQRLLHNTASTLYQLEEYQKALNEFSKVDPQQAKVPPSDYFYNLGNVLYRLEKYPEALEAFKKSLLADPRDADAKKNYELTLQKIKKKQPTPNPEPQQNKNNQEKQQEQSPEQRYQNLMKFLNQKEKELLRNQKRKAKTSSTGENDW